MPRNSVTPLRVETPLTKERSGGLAIRKERRPFARFTFRAGKGSNHLNRRGKLVEIVNPTMMKGAPRIDRAIGPMVAGLERSEVND